MHLKNKTKNKSIPVQSAIECLFCRVRDHAKYYLLIIQILDIIKKILKFELDSFI